MAKSLEPTKKQLETLINLFCTPGEISSFYRTTQKKLDEWCQNNYGGLTFKEVYEHVIAGSANVKVRHLQMKHAEKDPKMAIWLGKQYLGQKDAGGLEDAQKVIVLQNNVPKVE